MLKDKIKRFCPDWGLNCYAVIRFFPEFLKTLKLFEKYEPYSPQFYTNAEVVRKITQERCSLARFGDGEFYWMLGYSLNSYQNYSEELSVSLKEAVNTIDDKILIGLPIPLFNSCGCTIYSKMVWRCQRLKLLKDLRPLINFDRKFANACFTRPWIDYLNKDKATRDFSLLKNIWQDRNLIIVEGCHTKLGVGNDLFNNAKSIKRILGPAENAFSRLEEIISAIKKHASEEDLILTALGPTASILATRVAKIGFQIVDVGHIDVEYYWYINGIRARRPIKGKYVNEARTSEIFQSETSEDGYLRTIVEKII